VHRRRRSDGRGGGAGLIELDAVDLERLTAAVEGCGIRCGEFEISYEDYLQSEEIRVLSTSLDDGQIARLQEIERARPFPIVTFVSMDVCYRASQLLSARHKDEARAWLRQHGLLDRLPTAEKGEDPIQFARRLETFCGMKQGSALEFNEQLNKVTLKMHWIGQPLRKGWIWRTLHGAKHVRQFELFSKAVSAFDATEHGIHLGFIGNEAFAETDSPE
jgi:hypothetical protein